MNPNEVKPICTEEAIQLRYHGEAAEPSRECALLDEIDKFYKITTTVGRRAVVIALENCQLLDRKQQDYGPLNITMHGEAGVLVRMTDKIMRLNNLHQQKRRKPRNEAVLDSYRDISNYGIIGILVRTNQWM